MPAISIKLREIYGKPVAYPVCEKAKLFAALAGTKTLTPQALATIQKLGYEVTCLDAFGLPAGKLAA